MVRIQANILALHLVNLNNITPPYQNQNSSIVTDCAFTQQNKVKRVKEKGEYENKEVSKKVKNKNMSKRIKNMSQRIFHSQSNVKN